MAHGFSGTRHLGLPSYAERFASAGLAVLTFDYRNFGSSSGFPRQVIDVERQRQDFHAALKFARAREDIAPDRIALWGTSLSGGHVLAVAERDPDLAAVVMQIPYLDRSQSSKTIGRGFRGLLNRSMIRLLTAAAFDEVRRIFRLDPYLVKVVGNPGEAAVFTSAEARTAFTEMGGEPCGWRNEFAPRLLFAMPQLQPEAAARVSVPLLACIAEFDSVASPNLAIRLVSEASLGELKRYPASHFQAYYGSTFEAMVCDELDFLRRHLVAGIASKSATAAIVDGPYT